MADLELRVENVVAAALREKTDNRIRDVVITLRHAIVPAGDTGSDHDLDSIHGGGKG
jgi:hypothetical protein